MVSKSTKRKHRRNRDLLATKAAVRLKLIDPRSDFWLISQPDPQPGRPAWWTFHLEVTGKNQALKTLRHTAQGIKKALSPEILKASKPLNLRELDQRKLDLPVAPPSVRQSMLRQRWGDKAPAERPYLPRRAQVLMETISSERKRIAHAIAAGDKEALAEKDYLNLDRVSEIVNDKLRKERAQ